MRIPSSFLFIYIAYNPFMTNGVEVSMNILEEYLPSLGHTIRSTATESLLNRKLKSDCVNIFNVPIWLSLSGSPKVNEPLEGIMSIVPMSVLMKSIDESVSPESEISHST